MYVFLDVEFLPGDDGALPRLVSLGLCSAAGDEFYGELHQAPLPGDAKAFIGKYVMSQVRKIGDPESTEELANRLVIWLDLLCQPTLEVCYDFHTDYDLFEQLLGWAAPPPRTHLVPTHVGYLIGDPKGEEAAQLSWRVSKHRQDLDRHHALADARALCARFEAVHGSASGDVNKDTGQSSQASWPSGYDEWEPSPMRLAVQPAQLDDE